MNRKGFAPLVLILIVAGLLAAGGGVWYYRSRTAVAPSKEFNPTSSSTSTDNRVKSDLSQLKVIVPNGSEVLVRNYTANYISNDNPPPSDMSLEIKWTGAPGSFEDIYGDGKLPARIEVYLDKKIATNPVTVGRIMPFGTVDNMSSIRWAVGIVSNPDCLQNNDDATLYPNHCSHSVHLVGPGQYYVRIVDRLTGQSDRSDNSFTIKNPDRVGEKSTGADWRSLLLTEAKVTNNISLDLSGDGVDEMAVSYTLSIPNPFTFERSISPFVDRDGLMILKKENDAWRIILDQQPGAPGGGNDNVDKISINKIRAVNGKFGVEVGEEYIGANTAGNWFVLVMDGDAIKNIPSSDMRKIGLAKFGDTDEDRSYTQKIIEDDLIQETVPGYSANAARCCPDKPSVELTYRFTGNALELASAKEVATSGQ